MQLAGGSLPYLGLMRVHGVDTLAFLQGQLSNDVRLASGSNVLQAAYSNNQGRVVAFMTLVPHSSGMLALMPRELLAPTIDRLRRFVLRAKVKLEDASDELALAGVWSARPHGLLLPDWSDESLRFVEQERVAYAKVPQDTQRIFCIGARAGLAPEFDALLSTDASLAWRAADIGAGIPQVFTATSEQFVAQMLNLDALGAISFSKGCYTGQEIIARTQHLGRIKRRMFRVDLPSGDWTAGAVLQLPGRTGRIVDAVDVDGMTQSLAVLPVDADVRLGESTMLANVTTLVP